MRSSSCFWLGESPDRFPVTSCICRDEYTRLSQGASMAGFRALVVHLQPEALGELAEVLGSPQLAVDTARSVTEALNKVTRGDYAVIVTEHRPPAIDGFDFLDRTLASCPDAMRVVTAADPALFDEAA